MSQTRQGQTEILAEMVATVLSVDVAPGDRVAAGETVALLESMKMEIPVIADVGGTVQEVGIAPGDVVQEGDVLVRLGTEQRGRDSNPR